jgi:uncharacterized membrane protein
MNTRMTIILLFAAFVHAAWNLYVRGNDKATDNERWWRATMIAIVPIIPCIVAIIFLPLPPFESWIYLPISGVIHVASVYLLVQAFSTGEFSVIFPLARGTAPLFAAVGGSMIGDTLLLSNYVGVLLVAIGIAILKISWENREQALLALRNRGLTLTVAAGASIAAYTILDKFGAGTHDRLRFYSYSAWMFLWFGLLMFGLFCFSQRKTGAELFKNRTNRELTIIFACGLVAALAYCIVIFAVANGNAVGKVASLRETSILFAAILAKLCWPKNETFRIQKIIGTVIIFVGDVLCVYK